MNYAGKVTTRKRGKSWEYRFEIEPLDGKRRWKSKAGFVRQKEASVAGDKARMEYMKNSNPEKKENISVGAFADIWLEHIFVKKEITTYQAYQALVEKHIRPELGKIALKDLRYNDIENMLHKMCDDGLSKSTMGITKSILSNILSYAIKPYRYITYNPAKDAEVPESKKEKMERVPYTVEQLRQVLDQVPFGHDYRMTFVLGLYCGIRIGESIGLTWDCVNFENNTITIKQQLKVICINKQTLYIIKRLKTKRSYRTIHFGKEVREELLRELEQQQKDIETFGTYYSHVYSEMQIITTRKSQKELEAVYNITAQVVGKEELNLVCRRRNGRFINSASLNAFTRNLSEKLGYEIDTHTSRHTHATLAVEQGATITAVAARLGQADLKTTRGYVHSTDLMELEAMDCFERALTT